LKGAGETNGIELLNRNGYPLKQEGCFTRIRRGGSDTFANVPNKSMALSFSR
jgi:hypothetical protein